MEAIEKEENGSINEESVEEDDKDDDNQEDEEDNNKEVDYDTIGATGATGAEGTKEEDSDNENDGFILEEGEIVEDEGNDTEALVASNRDNRDSDDMGEEDTIIGATEDTGATEEDKNDTINVPGGEEKTKEDEWKTMEESVGSDEDRGDMDDQNNKLEVKKKRKRKKKRKKGKKREEKEEEEEEDNNSTTSKEEERDSRKSEEGEIMEDERKITETSVASDEENREEIYVDLQTRREEVYIDIDTLQSQIENCQDDHLEDLEKQMMELLTIQEELYSSEDEHDGNNGGAEGDSYHTMSDESRSSSENRDDDANEITATDYYRLLTAATTAQPMVTQGDQKIQVKFENKLLGMDVVKRNDILYIYMCIKSTRKNSRKRSK